MGQMSPEPHLGGALEFMRAVWALDHALSTLSRAMETRLGLTGPQRLVVRVVGRVPGISAGGLAAILHLDPSTLTGHLHRLAHAGLIERKQSTVDRRRVELRLTPAGRRLDVATPGTVEAALTQVFAAFGAGDLALARRVLACLAGAFDDQATVTFASPVARRAPLRKRKTQKRGRALRAPVKRSAR